MRLRTRRLSLVLPALALLAALTLDPARVAARPTGNLTTRVEGTFQGGEGGSGEFDGSFTLERFTAQGDRVIAIGSLDGSFTGSDGKRAGKVSGQAVQMELAASSLRATCKLASFTLGPTEVSLGGHQTRLSGLELEIEDGVSPELAAKLCELAKLVDSGARGSALSAQLDQVLAALG